MRYKIAVVFILLIAVFWANFDINRDKSLDYKINQVFPYKFNEWTGTDIVADKSVYTMIDPDELLFRKYKLNDKEVVLSIVLTKKRDHIHDPQVCYTGQGVNMNKERNINFDKINGLLVDSVKREHPFKIIYWYTDLNKTYSSRSEFMKNAVISSLLNKSNVDYALVSVSSKNINEEELKRFSSRVNQKLFKKDK